MKMNSNNKRVKKVPKIQKNSWSTII